jgi:hypothetical protein
MQQASNLLIAKKKRNAKKPNTKPWRNGIWFPEDSDSCYKTG